jgi:hypothetical protein
MKKTALTLAFIAALLCSVVAGALLVGLGSANPYFIGGDTPPPAGSEPPRIQLFSPHENGLLTSNNMSVAFNATISKDTYMLTVVYYEVDWQEGNSTVYSLDMSTPDYIYDRTWITEFSYNETLTGIPEGDHNITVVAVAEGSYVIDMTAYHFSISGFSTVKFTVDTTSPKISISSPEDNVYATPDVSLNFTTNEPVSQIMYVLDGQANVTVAGNTTLTSLSNGEHNITVYAVDLAGNVGSSETLVFMVAKPEPFPATSIAAASATAIAATGLGVLIYFKKRRT